MEKKTIFLAAILTLVILSGCIEPPQTICGDRVCDSTENPENCPQDCPIDEKTCLGQGGDDCSNGKVCVGKLIHASDTEECCSGRCRPPLVEPCGDGTCQSNESPETCPEDCEPPPESLELKLVIPEKAITPGDGQYKRPELLVVGERMFFGFELGREDKFRIVELNEDLTYKGEVYEVFAGPEELSPHDIRLATDGTMLWYAFETVKLGHNDTCEGHNLNIAKYDISGEEPVLENNKLYLASGCGTSPDDYAKPVGEFPKAPEAVDDPSPIFYNGEYVVLTRGWLNSIEHIRKFDSEFNLVDHILLDLGPATDNKVLAQNALVNIDGQIYIIGGLIKSGDRDDSSIYAIPLSNDLTSVSGEIIPLVNYPGQIFRKVTAARYKEGKLYINYAKVIDRQQFHHLGVFDVENDFASLAEIQVQDKSVSINHSSMEVFGNRVYFVYLEDETGLFDVLGQVFEWQ